MKKKVLHFIHGLNMGGAETLVTKYASLLDKKKYEVIVLCYQHYPDSPYEEFLKQKGIPLLYACDAMPFYGKNGYISKLINHYQMYLEIRKAIHKINPDIIHTHLPHNHFLHFATPKRGTKIFYTQHSSISRWLKLNRADVKHLQWIIQRYPTRLIALTPKMKRELDVLFSVNNTVIIRNGIETERYRQTINRHAKRLQLGIPLDAFLIVHVGRFSPVKNHHFLVDIFQEISKRVKKAWLLMVGSGEEEASIRKKLHKNGQDEHYLILSNRTDVAEILQCADVGVFPSISEGLGIAFVEMQAAGLPIVVSDAVPRTAQISERVKYLSLSEKPEVWTDELLKLYKCSGEINEELLRAWDISESVKELEKIYEM